MSSSDNIKLSTNKRLFYISDNIDNTTISVVNFNLLYILQEDDEREAKEKDFKRSPIKIYINSNGGAIDDMWSLIDIMLSSKSPIYTYCTGYAYSAGFLIFLAGSKRFMSPHARLMFHQMSCCRSGKYQDLVEDRPEIDYLQNEIIDYVISRTAITKDQVQEWLEKKQDTYFHNEEAIKLGIIDKNHED